MQKHLDRLSKGGSGGTLQKTSSGVWDGSWLIRLFGVCYFLWFCIFTVIICRNFSLSRSVEAIFSLVLFLFVGWAVSGPADRLSRRGFSVLFYILLAAAFIASFLLAYAMRICLPTDTNIIFTSVADLLRDGKLNEPNPDIDARFFKGLGLYTNSDYFCRYPNNIGLLLLYTGLYAVCGKFGIQAGADGSQAPAICLMALAVAVTAFFLCKCVRLLFRRNSYVLLTLLLFYLFVPFVFGIPNFYTDLWVVFFTVAGVYCYLRDRSSEKGRPGLLLCSGVLIAVGVQMKPTAAVAIVAIAIELLLCRRPARRWVRLAAFLSGVCLFSAAFVLWYRTCGWFDFSRADEIGAPWQLWLLIGSHAKGGIDLHEDMRFAASFPTMAERAAAVWEQTVQNYRSYSFLELLQFMREKLVYAWGSGMFEADAYLLWPLEGNWTAFLTQPEYRPAQLIGRFSEVYLLFLYYTNAAACAIAWLRRKTEQIFLPNLTVFGIMLFLLIFENGARRAILAIPFMILNAVFFLDQWREYAESAGIVTGINKMWQRAVSRCRNQKGDRV